MKYEVKFTFIYILETNNIDEVLNSYEHPVFPTLDDDQVSFMEGWTNWDLLREDN